MGVKGHRVQTLNKLYYQEQIIQCSHWDSLDCSVFLPQAWTWIWRGKSFFCKVLVEVTQTREGSPLSWQIDVLVLYSAKRHNGNESEQMKSNKIGSHITGRATNGHWNGSHFFSCFDKETGEKSHQLWSKKQVVISPEAQLTASTKI